MTLVREIVRMTTINYIYCAYNDTTQYTSKATQVSLKLAVRRIGVNLKSPHLGHTNYIEANRRVEKKVTSRRSHTPPTATESAIIRELVCYLATHLSYTKYI